MDINNRLQRLMERRGETPKEFETMLESKYPGLFNGVPQTTDGYASVGSTHGHVFPNVNQIRARCGGPNFCSACQKDLGLKSEIQASAKFIKAYATPEIDEFVQTTRTEDKKQLQGKDPEAVQAKEMEKAKEADKSIGSEMSAAPFFQGTDVPEGQQVLAEESEKQTEPKEHPQSFVGIPENIDPMTVDRLLDIALPTNQELNMRIFAAVRLKALTLEAITEEDFHSWNSKQQQQWIKDHPDSRFKPKEDSTDDIDEIEDIDTEEDDGEEQKDEKKQEKEERKRKLLEQRKRETERLNYIKEQTGHMVDDIINLGQDPSQVALEFNDDSDESEDSDDTEESDTDKATKALAILDSKIKNAESKLSTLGDSDAGKKIEKELETLMRQKEQIANYLASL